MSVAEYLGWDVSELKPVSILHIERINIQIQTYGMIAKRQLSVVDPGRGFQGLRPLF